MKEQDPPLDYHILLPQEFVAQSMLQRFPQSSLRMKEVRGETIFEIYFQEKLLVKLDKKGARYYFPSRRKRMVRWDKFTTLDLGRVIDYILRDLAEANYEVFSSTNKQLRKRPIHISRLKRCPECKQGGSIKIIVRGETLAVENSQIYTTIPFSTDINGAEIKCTLCGWIGIREQLPRKVRRPRK